MQCALCISILLMLSPSHNSLYHQTEVSWGTSWCTIGKPNCRLCNPLNSQDVPLEALGASGFCGNQSPRGFECGLWMGGKICVSAAEFPAWQQKGECHGAAALIREEAASSQAATGKQREKGEPAAMLQHTPALHWGSRGLS